LPLRTTVNIKIKIIECMILNFGNSWIALIDHGLAQIPIKLL